MRSSCLAFVEKLEQRTCSQRDQLEAKINSAKEEYITKIQSNEGRPKTN